MKKFFYDLWMYLWIMAVWAWEEKMGRKSRELNERIEKLEEEADEAYEKGYSHGHQDGYHEGYADGWDTAKELVETEEER